MLGLAVLVLALLPLAVLSPAALEADRGLVPVVVWWALSAKGVDHHGHRRHCHNHCLESRARAAAQAMQQAVTPAIEGELAQNQMQHPSTSSSILWSLTIHKE